MIGILPCAGYAERFMNLPKYLLPCPGGYLLERHIRDMKLHCDGIAIGTNGLSHLFLTRMGYKVFLARNRETMTQTVQSALMDASQMVGSDVLFGMPDTYFECRDVYQYLANTLKHCDVAVAVCKARPDQHSQGGMVGFSHNVVTEVIDKPAETSLEYIWGALAWKPAFWDCLEPDMPHVGYGLPVALERGLNVRAVVCEGGFWDCGTFERYVDMIKATT